MLELFELQKILAPSDHKFLPFEKITKLHRNIEGLVLVLHQVPVSGCCSELIVATTTTIELGHFYLTLFTWSVVQQLRVMMLSVRPVSMFDFRFDFVLMCAWCLLHTCNQFSDYPSSVFRVSFSLVHALTPGPNLVLCSTLSTGFLKSRSCRTNPFPSRSQVI